MPVILIISIPRIIIQMAFFRATTTTYYNTFLFRVKNGGETNLSLKKKREEEEVRISYNINVVLLSHPENSSTILGGYPISSCHFVIIVIIDTPTAVYIYTQTFGMNLKRGKAYIYIYTREEGIKFSVCVYDIAH